MSKLKPCPFCGGTGHMQRFADSDGFGTFYYVVCTGCRAQSGSQYASKGNDCPQTYAEVRDLWNRRASLVQGTEATAGGGVTDGVARLDGGHQ
jgi:Lar family restriction alleviation protein